MRNGQKLKQQLTRFFLGAVGLLCISGVNAQPVILNAVGSNYVDIQSKAAEIAEIGYSTVLVIPPSLESASQCNKAERFCAGSLAEFKQLVIELNRFHIKTYADVLITSQNPETIRLLVNYIFELYDLNITGFRLTVGQEQSVQLFADESVMPIYFQSNEFLFIEPRTVSDYSEAPAVKFADSTEHKSVAFSTALYKKFKSEFHLTDHAQDETPKTQIILNYQSVSNLSLYYQVADPVEQQFANAYLFGRQQGIPMVSLNDMSYGSSLDHLALNEELAAMIKFRKGVAVHDEEAAVQASECLVVFKRGTRGFVAINRCEEMHVVKVPKSLNVASAHYTNTLSEQNFISERVILPNSYAMWLGR